MGDIMSESMGDSISETLGDFVGISRLGIQIAASLIGGQSYRI
jgi:hypothetical protein